MSAAVFWGALLLLAVGVWLLTIISFWYGRELLKRQKELTLLLLPYLHQVKLDQKVMHSLKIDKDEPIGKYKEVTLPEQVAVSFVDKEKLK